MRPDDNRPRPRPVALTGPAAALSFEQRVIADTRTLVGLRRDLAHRLSGLAMTPELQEDVVLAVYEAMANAVEHGYRDRDGSGPLQVRADLRADELTVTVVDQGVWRPPDGADPYRGRGLPLIEMLAHRSSVAHRAEGGTTVTMTWRLTGPG